MKSVSRKMIAGGVEGRLHWESGRRVNNKEVTLLRP